jgi:nitrogen-specific signal transduction histidine kinase
MPPDPAPDRSLVPPLFATPAGCEGLATPVAWLAPDGALAGCNPAFASWLGVSARRLQAMALADLDVEVDRLQPLLGQLPAGGGPLRVHRARLAFPGGSERFAELWLSAPGDGFVLLEAHPTGEFPGEDPATMLPAALAAALKGLAHEIRNPLAGLKGAAQLLARRVEARDAQALIGVIESEVDRLAAPARDLALLVVAHRGEATLVAATLAALSLATALVLSCHDAFLREVDDAASCRRTESSAIVEKRKQQ